MIDRMLSLFLIGGEPILYLLIALSFMSIAVVLERLLYYARNRVDVHTLSAGLVRSLNVGDVASGLDLVTTAKGAEVDVVREGLQNFDKGSLVAGELMESMALRHQQLLDKRLTFIGTIGSNAPFIGLLGTVMGIIKAFHDLAIDSQGGPSVVMAGIAEALVATAVGLLVAIPAVIFYNYFKNRQKQILNNVQQLQNLIKAFIVDGGSKASDEKASE
jgi:biopolymer transport protein ExbB